jgi:hypothetical protein
VTPRSLTNGNEKKIHLMFICLTISSAVCRCRIIKKENLSIHKALSSRFFAFISNISGWKPHPGGASFCHYFD